MTDPQPAREPFWVHVALLVVATAAVESLYQYAGLNLMDELWPVHAASALRDGGVLYRDVFWVFPPGHLLAAWLGAVIDPPGIYVARAIYAAFDVALVVAIYALGRRIVAPPFAVLAALLVVFAAPTSHLNHLVFGFRYLVWGAAALLCVARRLDGGDRRWLFAAGVLVGVGVWFRWTAATATAAAIGVAVFITARGFRPLLRDVVALVAGTAVVVIPLLGYFAVTVGLENFLREVVMRPVVMIRLQTSPVPPLGWPAGWGDRTAVAKWFTAVEFRAVPLLYAGYLLALGVGLWRSLRAKTVFPHALLATVVAWGAIFFIRSTDRADAPHLESALPPACLVFAHLVQTVTRRTDAVAWGACAAVLAVWIGAQGTDRVLDSGWRAPTQVRSVSPPTGYQRVRRAAAIDERVRAIRQWTRPGERVLDLSASPGLLALAGRPSPGLRDLVMPGTFLDEAEEREFLAHLQANPPALVILPQKPFDGRKARAVKHTAPLVLRWVREHYVREGPGEIWQLLRPRLRR